MEQAQVDMLRQTVTIETVSGVDVANNKVYNAPVTYACRIQQKMTDIRSEMGVSRVASETYIYLDVNVDVTADDKITLPYPYVPTSPSIKSVNKVPDVEGTGSVYYTKVSCE